MEKYQNEKIITLLCLKLSSFLNHFQLNCEETTLEDHQSNQNKAS